MATLALLACLSTAARADGDPARGAQLFEKECADCHSARPGENRKGPTLFGVVGRDMGTVQGFSYSGALISRPMVWTPDKLDAYMAAPRELLPRTKMKYIGLTDARARADIIAFLSTLR